MCKVLIQDWGIKLPMSVRFLLGSPRVTKLKQPLVGMNWSDNNPICLQVEVKAQSRKGYKYTKWDSYKSIFHLL